MTTKRQSLYILSVRATAFHSQCLGCGDHATADDAVHYGTGQFWRKHVNSKSKSQGIVVIYGDTKVVDDCELFPGQS